MTPTNDPTTLICAALYVTFAFYATGLWVFALFRTRMTFCYFFIASAIVGAILSVFAVAMYLDPYIWVRLLGRAGYRVSYYFVIVVQPTAYLVNIIGATMLVRWLTKRSNQAMQLTEPRSDA
jgi:ABC-type multidrug transport system permease subunit